MRVKVETLSFHKYKDSHPYDALPSPIVRESCPFPVTLKDVETAHERVKPYVHETPILTSQALNKMANKNNNINDSNISLFFKCENFQKTGSFKIRGATNAVFSLTDEEASNGICTHSSGNHAQAVAQAALWRDIDATIVMPDNAPPVKKTAVIGYKANVVTCKQSERATRCDVVGSRAIWTGRSMGSPGPA